MASSEKECAASPDGRHHCTRATVDACDWCGISGMRIMQRSFGRRDTTELRPPTKHAKHGSLHWIGGRDAPTTLNAVVWRWWETDGGYWVNDLGREYRDPRSIGTVFRYLGPAEPPDRSLNPYDPDSQLVLVHRQDHVRTLARIAELEAELYLLKHPTTSPAHEADTFPPNALKHSI